MKERAVFVPADGRHIAAVVTIPEGEPRGVVLLTTGAGGVPRSHRYSLWTKMARRLAERDIAAVRMEWPGVGDSTGVVNMRLESLPVSETAAVARFAMAAVGTDRLGMLGNCAGARTAIQLVTTIQPAESLALLMLKPLYRRSADGSMSRKARGVAIRLPRPVKAVIRPIYWRLPGKSRRGDGIMDTLSRVAGTTDLLLLEPPTQQVGSLPRFVKEAQARGGPYRIELRDCPHTMSDFESLDDQEYLLSVVADWFDRSFSREAIARRTSAAGLRKASA